MKVTARTNLARFRLFYTVTLLFTMILFNPFRVEEGFAEELSLIAKRIKVEHADVAGLERVLGPLLTASGSLSIDERTNSIIIRDEEAAVRLIEETIADLDTKIPSQTFRLNYADPIKVAPKIRRVLGSDDAIVEPDTRTHTIYVAATEARLERVRSLVEELDRPARQVLIEANILDVSSGRLKELGVEWELRLGYDGGNKDFTYRSDTRRDSTDRPSTGTISVGAPSITIPAVIDPFSGTVITPEQVIPGSDFSATIQALIEDSSTRILSRPNILVLDGHQARFNVSTREPYANFDPAPGDASGYSLEIKFLDIGIILEVIPRINDEDYVTMEIKAKISSLVGEVFFDTTIIPDEGGAVTSTIRVPVEAESVADTVVKVRSDQTIAIGGLGSREEMESTRKVPILGDIPILGIPFRNLNQLKDTRELIIFITPHIISPDISSPKAQLLERAEASKE